MNNHSSSKLVSKMKTNHLLLVTLLATPPPAAAKPAVAVPVKAYPLKVCLVTDSDLDSMGDEVSIVYQGQEIKFCCKPCEKKFLRAPEKYLAKLAAMVAEKK